MRGNLITYSENPESLYILLIEYWALEPNVSLTMEYGACCLNPFRKKQVVLEKVNWKQQNRWSGVKNADLTKSAHWDENHWKREVRMKGSTRSWNHILVSKRRKIYGASYKGRVAPKSKIKTRPPKTNLGEFVFLNSVLRLE